MMTADTNMKKYIFVCYASEDSNNVLPLIGKLKKAGVYVWQDVESITGASFWSEEIVNAICSCSLVIFFATKASCQSKNVAKELSIANEENRPILPVYLEEVDLSPELRYQLAGIQNIHWREEGISFGKILDAARCQLGESCNQDNDIDNDKLVSPKKLNIFRWGFKKCLVLIVVVVLFIIAFSGIYRKIFVSQTSSSSHAEIEMGAKDNSIGSRSVFKIPHDTWYIETIMKKSDHKPFVGLRVYYRVLLAQEDSTLSIRGEKIGESIHDNYVEYTGKSKTPIYLKGQISGSVCSNVTMKLIGEEGSTSRGSFTTLFSLDMVGSNALAGVFKSTAGNAKGSAVWISEKEWLRHQFQTSPKIQERVLDRERNTSSR